MKSGDFNLHDYGGDYSFVLFLEDILSKRTRGL